MKRKRNGKRILAALLALILLYCIVSAAVSAVVYRAIYPRSDGYDAFTLRYEDIGAACPLRRLRFDSGDHRLSACLITCDEPQALVVIAAGIGDGARSHLSAAAAFAGMGYDVFCYDATGVGYSEGDGVVGLSQPCLDLRAALDYIAADAALSRLPVLLYAHSAGGWGAAVSCGDRPQVKAAVIMAAFDSPVSLMHANAKQRVGVLADIEYPFMVIENERIFGDMANVSAAGCLSRCRIPVLLIQGSDDSLIPPELRLSSYADRIRNPLVAVHIVDGGGHSGLWLSADAQAYRAGFSGGEPDRRRANKLDSGFMNMVKAFFHHALE